MKGTTAEKDEEEEPESGKPHPRWVPDVEVRGPRCPRCPQVCRDNLALEIHVVSHYHDLIFQGVPDSAPFICPGCKKEHKDRMTLVRHWAFAHRTIYSLTDLTQEDMINSQRGDCADSGRSRILEKVKQVNEQDCGVDMRHTQKDSNNKDEDKESKNDEGSVSSSGKERNEEQDVDHEENIGEVLNQNGNKTTKKVTTIVEVKEPEFQITDMDKTKNKNSSHVKQINSSKETETNEEVVQEGDKILKNKPMASNKVNKWRKEKTKDRQIIFTQIKRRREPEEMKDVEINLIGDKNIDACIKDVMEESDLSVVAKKKPRIEDVRKKDNDHLIPHKGIENQRNIYDEKHTLNKNEEKSLIITGDMIKRRRIMRFAKRQRDLVESTNKKIPIKFIDDKNVASFIKDALVESVMEEKNITDKQETQVEDVARMKVVLVIPDESSTIIMTDISDKGSPEILGRFRKRKTHGGMKE